MARRSNRIVVAALAVASALAAGCGQEEPPDLVNGKRLFAGEGRCGSCHALSRAATKGNQGPDLDEAFGPARDNGLGRSTIEGVVRDQIENTRRGSIMPEDLVKGDDVDDVAAYVALVAGMPGKDTGALAAVGPRKGGKPAVAKGGVLNIAADPSGALAYVTAKAMAEAGKVEFVMPNESPVQHDIAIKGGGASGKGATVGQGGTSRFSTTLKPGKYTYFCTVPGHEPGGMKGELTVE